MNNDCPYKQLMPNCKWHYDCRLKIELGHNVTSIECKGFDNECPLNKEAKEN